MIIVIIIPQIHVSWRRSSGEVQQIISKVWKIDAIMIKLTAMWNIYLEFQKTTAQILIKIEKDRKILTNLDLLKLEDVRFLWPAVSIPPLKNTRSDLWQELKYKTPFGSGIATIYDPLKMSDISTIKFGTQMIDLSVTIGRCSSNSQHGGHGLHPAYIGCSNFRYPNNM